jgi:hypothetical protein
MPAQHLLPLWFSCADALSGNFFKIFLQNAQTGGGYCHALVSSHGRPPPGDSGESGGSRDPRSAPFLVIPAFSLCTMIWKTDGSYYIVE